MTDTSTAWYTKLKIVGPYDKQRDRILDGHAHWTGEARFIPEPGNPHDPDAIRVAVGTATIGYVKATTTKHYRRALGTTSTTLYCHIVRTHNGGHLVTVGTAPAATARQARWYTTITGDPLPAGLDYLQASALIAAAA